MACSLLYKKYIGISRFDFHLVLEREGWIGVSIKAVRNRESEKLVNATLFYMNIYCNCE